MRRVGGDDEDGLADLGELHGHAAAARGLADAALAAYEDPPQRLLVEQILERRLERLQVNVVGAAEVDGGRGLRRRHRHLRLFLRPDLLE